MEQPPGSLDDLQPQDLSTSTVIDLTGSGEECVLNPASLEALRLVKSPGWYPGTGTGDPTLPFIETGSSDITLQPGDQVQPDNAFSHTTVTLSYVSRSHVFSAQDSIYSVTPVSLLPLHTDLDKGLVETGAYALNQHYVEEAQGPVDLATRMELFQALSGAQMGPDYHGGVCLTQAANGGVILSEGDIVTHVEMEAEQSLSMENSSSVFENGQGDSWCSSVVVETLSPTIMEEERVDFPLIHKPDPLLALDSLDDRDPPSPDKEYLSPLEEPVSPSAPSPDNVEDVFILPQACSSPGADTVHLETANEVVWNASSTAGAIQLSSDITDGTTRSDSSCENKRPVRRRKALLEPLIDLTDDDCVSEVSQVKPKPVVAHMNGNAKESERTLKVKKLPMRLGRGTRLEAIVMNLNSGRYKFSGCIRTNKKANTPKSKASDSKLASLKPNDAPPVVAQKKGKVKASPSVKSVKQKAASPTKRAQTNNNNTDSCKDSTSDIEINHSKKTHNGTTSPKSPRSAVHKNSKDSVEIHAKSPPPPPPVPPPQSPKKSPGKGKALGSKTSPTAKSKGASTAKSKGASTPKTTGASTPKTTGASTPKTKGVSTPKTTGASTPKSKGASTPKTTGASTPKTTGASTPKTTGASTPKTTGASTPKTTGASTPKTTGASTPKTTGASTPKTTGASTPKTKGASTPKPKRRRKKISITCQPLSSMFSPKEPEIRLRYLQHKEEKRELRIDAFSPFIHVERKQTSPSLCSVVNDPQEVRTPHKKLTQPGSGFISATVPTTSCLQLGRPSTHSQQHGPLVCCLCGRATNTMDLGDLHGPYYPEGFRPSTKTAASTSGLKEDDNGYSDSDSSACSVRGRGRRKRAVPRPLRPGGAQPQSQQWSLDGTGSPSAKRARSDAGTADVEDWYSPPVLPLEPCEYWLHEDCAVWSAGVFLVKGRVYGLEEAVKAAQETTCSACQNPGASLGCFFKGCPNKYHYRCALESDCVLIEENFSMKCKKHKNKTFKSPPGNRWKDR